MNVPSTLRRLLSAAISLLVVVGSDRDACAHGLTVNCSRLANGRLEIRVEYEDGAPATEAEIRVLDDDDIISEGNADSAGRLVLDESIDRPLRIEARHAGHRRVVGIAVDDTGELRLEGSNTGGMESFASKIVRIVAGCVAILVAAVLIGKLLGLRRQRPRLEESEEDRSAP